MSKIREATAKLMSDIIESGDPEFTSITITTPSDSYTLIYRKKGSSSHNKRAYLASSSKGDRSVLRAVSYTLSRKGYMIFSPCLGFIGHETPEIRPAIMQVCLSALSEWAEVLFVLDEGIPSKGCDIECEAARSINIPIIKIKETTVHKLRSLL